VSYNSHQRFVLDSTLPLPHRYSHLRSCALKISFLLKRQRSDIIADVFDRTGINIEKLGDEAQLIRALNCLNEMRSAVLESKSRTLHSKN